MSAISIAADLVYAYRFIKLLVKDWEDTEAFKLGIIDANGKLLKKRREGSKEKAAYTAFVRLAFNIKRLIGRVPGASTKLGSLATALFLMREETGMSEKRLLEALKKGGHAIPEDMLNESASTWNLRGGVLPKGVYRITCATLHPEDDAKSIRENSSVIVESDQSPVGYSLGQPIFEVFHAPTRSKIYVSNLQLRA